MSERKRYFIDVEMDTVNLTGNGEWCSVRIPSKGPCVIPVRFRDLRDAPDDEQLRRERDATRQDRDACRRDAERAERERDQLRGQVAEMERELSNRQPASDSLQVERDALRRDLENARASLVTTSDQLALAQDQRDEARREAEELRRKRDEWRSEAIIKHGQWRDARDLIEELREERDMYGQHIAEEAAEPAPQTHFFKPGDVVLLNDGDTVTLEVPLRNTACPGEVWKPDTCDEVYIHPDRYPILERDGTPTDAGLRRLAERVGRSFDSRKYLRGCGFFCVDGERVRLDKAATDDDRRALAAALREMGDDSQPREGRKARSDE